MNSDEQKLYQKNIKIYQPKSHIFKNGLKAFVVGGLICTLGHAISQIYMHFLPITQEEAMSPTLATLILLAALATGFGVYDKLGQFAGAGSLVPVTGFSNAMTSAALEHKSEGLVFGIGANMFKLTGAVIAFGVLSAYLVSLTRLLVEMLINS
ncbi:stage V sporulation protein AC [Halalkalibacter akibai]|uniref:Stage V sporulation protein AC n=1 Tax=Halalkalibacter akibai (strain ATCC 43226 / DSM 21942 / CIP 109018 / JCM 9157 / 1139) TaxID=1236973 RepID=W4QYL8_HALA3|nr:stage V sporulation protein AC [Halalkalibacter akibai]GAE36763.1 stage V sporulation protein AC [Halalkalibacter akibai JCM 9157]